MKAILRSVLPAVLILAVVGAAAIVGSRAISDSDPMAQPQPWTPPAGFVETVSVPLADGNRVSLWLGRIGPPKPDDGWYLVHTGPGGYFAVGGGGGLSGQPWVIRLAGVVAGGTGEDSARWVRIGGGSPIAVTEGHFIAVASLWGQTTSVELLDENQVSLASFPEVFVGGEGEPRRGEPG